jgi:hypothetical protein
MLRLVLEREEPVPDQTLGELVSEALSGRARLDVGADTRAGRATADRIGDALAYDAALVRLCQRLSIQHDLLGDSPPNEARLDAEARLADRLPSIAVALADSRPGSAARGS